MWVSGVFYLVSKNLFSQSTSVDGFVLVHKIWNETKNKSTHLSNENVLTWQNKLQLYLVCMSLLYGRPHLCQTPPALCDRPPGQVGTPHGPVCRSRSGRRLAPPAAWRWSSSRCRFHPSGRWHKAGGAGGECPDAAKERLYGMQLLFFTPVDGEQAWLAWETTTFVNLTLAAKNRVDKF